MENQHVEGMTTDTSDIPPFMLLLIIVRIAVFVCISFFNTDIACFKLPIRARKLQFQSSYKYYAKKYDPADFVIITAEKPLGISLTEIDPVQPLGVCIDEIFDGPIKQDARAYKGLFLLEVNGVDVRRSSFDAVMDTLAQADGAVTLIFIDRRRITRGAAEISIVTAQGNTTISALKGQNLRNVLLEQRIPIYTGKAKLTNCGGAGTCGTCAVVVIEKDGWEERPEFERLRLKKYPDSARLSCNTIIEGDCTVIIQPPLR